MKRVWMLPVPGHYQPETASVAHRGAAWLINPVGTPQTT